MMSSSIICQKCLFAWQPLWNCVYAPTSWFTPYSTPWPCMSSKKFSLWTYTSTPLLVPTFYRLCRHNGILSNYFWALFIYLSTWQWHRVYSFVCGWHYSCRFFWLFVNWLCLSLTLNFPWRIEARPVIFPSQNKYAEEVIEHTCMSAGKSSPTHVDTKAKLSGSSGNPYQDPT